MNEPGLKDKMILYGKKLRTIILTFDISFRVNLNMVQEFTIWYHCCSQHVVSLYYTRWYFTYFVTCYLFRSSYICTPIVLVLYDHLSDKVGLLNCCMSVFHFIHTLSCVLLCSVYIHWVLYLKSLVNTPLCFCRVSKPPPSIVQWLLFSARNMLEVRLFIHMILISIEANTLKFCFLGWGFFS